MKHEVLLDGILISKHPVVEVWLAEAAQNLIADNEAAKITWRCLGNFDYRPKSIDENGKELEKNCQVISLGIYEGYWKDGKKYGTGRYIAYHGGYYIGNWEADHKCGHGIWRLRDGTTYEGEWKES